MIKRPLGPAPASAAARPAARWPYAFAPRFLVVLGLGVLALAPAWIDPRAALVLAGWNAILFIAWVVDLRRLPRPAQLSVTREWAGALTLGTTSGVTLRLSNLATTGITARVHDHAAGTLAPEVPSVSIAAAADGEEQASYDVTPRARGDAKMGPVALRYRSAWGLAERWAIAPVQQTVRVYPDLAEARRQTMYLIRSRQVSIERRRVRVSGLGRDFESLRDYRDGDEPRDICWTATARRAKVVTKVYQPERSQAVWIVLDSGRLLRARIDREMKLDRMVNAALALAQVAMAAGDRVGLLAYGRASRHRLAPGRGPSHLRALVEALAMVTAEPVEADHIGAAATIMAAQTQRALVAWLTDIAETAGVPDVVDGASRLTSRHLVVVGVMRQPDIAALAAGTPGSGADMYRMLAAQETIERREVLLAGLRQRGVLALEVDPGEMTSALVSQYLSAKDRNLV